MASSLKFDKRSLTSLIKRVDQISKVAIDVGFFEEDKYGPENSNLQVAQVAFYNERGLGNLVPSRPFMERTFSEAMDLQFYATGMTSVFKDVLQQGRLTQQKIKLLGQHVVDVMQMNIIDWTSPPNSDAWAAIKGKNDPLVFTEKMLDSVKFKVERTNA